MPKIPSDPKPSPALLREKSEREERRNWAQHFDSGYVRRASLTAEVLFQSKWRTQILSILCFGPIRLGQLARLIPGASKKMLTQNLRRLESHGIVVRTDLSDLVLHVEYELNPEVRNSVCELMDHLAVWSDQYRARMMSQARYQG